MSADELLTRAEAARLLGKDTLTIWRYGREGKIDRVKVGGQFKYRRSQVEALIEREGELVGAR